MSEIQQQRRLIPPARKMPLEEVIASVDFPVYGLARPICNFQYSQCLLSTRVSISYYSDRYVEKLRDAQKHLRYKRIVSACFLSSMKGSEEEYEMLVSQRDPDHKVICFIQLSDPDAREPLKDIEPITLTRQEITIDGAHFIGDVKHYGSPFFYSIADLRSSQTCLFGEFYGPDLEEVFGILQALCVLGSKPVE